MTDPYFATVRQAIKSRGFVAGPDRGPKFRFQCFQPFAPRAKRMTNEPSILVSEVALGNIIVGGFGFRHTRLRFSSYSVHA